MKYFTRELLARCRSLDDDVAESAAEEWEEAIARYNDRLGGIRSRLPLDVRKLLADVTLHDATVLVRTISSGANVDSATLRVRLEGSESKPGEVLELHYSLVRGSAFEVFPRPSECLQEGQASDLILYDEFELDEQSGIFMHSLLLADGSEMRFRFRQLRILRNYIHHQEPLALRPELLLAVASRMRNTAVAAPETLRYLFDRGWYPLEFPVGLVGPLNDLIRAGRHEDVDKMMCDLARQYLPTIETEVGSNFPKRKEVVADAFDAHHHGKYTLSILVFLTQAEDIRRDFLGVRERHYFLGSILNEEVFVRHGLDLDHATETNSLRCALLLRFLLYASGQKANQMWQRDIDEQEKLDSDV